MHPLHGALPAPHVPVRVTLSALVTHWYTYVPPCCRALHYRRTCIPLSRSEWNDLADPILDGVGQAGCRIEITKVYRFVARNLKYSF